MGLCLALCALGGVRAWGLDLVREGKPAATIVLPEQANAVEQAAAQALANYIKQASGVALKVVKEPETPEGPKVSVGRTRLAQAAGVTTEGLEYDGYRMAVRGQVLYLLGRDTPRKEGQHPWLGAQGTYRAALALLEKLGFRWLAPERSGVHVPSLASASVADDLSVTYNPAFMYVTGRLYKFGDWSMANSFRTAVMLYTRGGHTWVEFVPAELWDQHPEYFRMQGGRRIKPTGNNYFLCPSNPDVIELLAQGIRKKFDEGYELVQLGQSDGYEPCECERCRALDKPGEVHEQVHVPHFQVIQAVGRTHPDKKVHLLIYGPTRTPSPRIDKYPDNVVLEICSSNEDVIKPWSARAPSGSTVYVYYMGTYQSVGLAPKCTPKMIAEEVQKLHRLGVRGIYFCGAGENWGAEGPTYYVAGRMLTDPSQDWSLLLDEYCDLMFGAAGRTMRRYYDLLYRRVEGGAAKLDGGPEIFPSMYPPHVLEKLESLMELAKTQAAGDERVTNWLRTADLARRHLSLIAKVYLIHNTYECNRTMENLKQTRDAVAEYSALAAEIQALGKKERKFVREYFPNYSRWSDVATNAGHLGAPFKWDFEALIQAGMLPGKSRGRAVAARLKTAPRIDGVLDDAEWGNAPWVEIREIALGKSEAATRVRIGYDDKGVYFGFECGEPLIEEMVVKNYGQDGTVWRTECVELFFDPEGNGEKLMHFIAAPSEGTRYDERQGYIDDPLHPLVLKKQADASWNPEWAHAFQIDKAAKRWTIEIAIPYSSLGVEPPVEGARWRVNLGRERGKSRWDPVKYRKIPVELMLWSPNLQKASFMDTSVFGDLYFGRVPEGK